MTPIQILLDIHNRLDPALEGWDTQVGLFAKHHDGSLWIPIDTRFRHYICHGYYRNADAAYGECDNCEDSELESDDYPLMNVETGHVCCINCQSGLQWLYLDITSAIWVEEHGDTYQLDGRTYYHDADHPCAWYQEHDDCEEGMSQEQYYAFEDYGGRKGHTMLHNHDTDEWLCWDCVGIEECS